MVNKYHKKLRTAQTDAANAATGNKVEDVQKQYAEGTNRPIHKTAKKVKSRPASDYPSDKKKKKKKKKKKTDLSAVGAAVALAAGKDKAY
jgi:hypothetical protein